MDDRAVGLRLGLIFKFGLLELCSNICSSVLFLFELSFGGDGTTVDGLVLLGGLAGGILAALAVGVFSRLETVNLLLGLGDVLFSY